MKREINMRFWLGDIPFAIIDMDVVELSPITHFTVHISGEISYGAPDWIFSERELYHTAEAAAYHRHKKL